MKINDINGVNRFNPYRHNSGIGHASPVGKKAKGEDRLQISEEAMKLLGSQEMAPADPARAKLIENLKQSVSTGTYRVDAGKIAEKLLPYLNK